MQAFDHVREDVNEKYSQKDNKQLTGLYGKRVSALTSKLTYLPYTSGHDFRRLYAKMPFEEFADTRKVSENGRVKKVLNHDNICTSIHSNSTLALNKENIDMDALRSKVNNHTGRLNTMED